MRVYATRQEAGRALAEVVGARGYADPVVLALPRGGLPVAAEVARALSAPLDLVLVRKLGFPGQPELALGAIVDGDTPELVLNEELRGALDRASDTLQSLRSKALAELERRRARYLKDRARARVSGATAIVIDDGIATGATARAALRSLRRQGPARLVLAVPVAPPDTLAALSAEADDVICLEAPAGFYAVGQFYAAFPQLSDQEVVDILAAFPSPAAPSPTA